MNNEVLETIKSLAKEETRYECSEDFVPYDFFGGNMDDAYDAGIEDARIELARELLSMIGGGDDQ